MHSIDFRYPNEIALKMVKRIRNLKNIIENSKKLRSLVKVNLYKDFALNACNTFIFIRQQKLIKLNSGFSPLDQPFSFFSRKLQYKV